MKNKVKSIDELGLFSRLAVKILTKLQKVAIKRSWYSIYYFLSKKHFKVYFGKDLIEEVASNTEEARAAARRHGRLVLKNALKDMPKKHKRNIYPIVCRKFLKDILLEAKL